MRFAFRGVLLKKRTYKVESRLLNCKEAAFFFHARALTG